VFKGVDEPGLAKLAAICRPVAMKDGDVIIKEGEKGDCVFFIHEGQVEISMNITLGQELWEEAIGAVEKVLVKLGPGAMFGEMAFIFDEDVRSATIIAKSDGSLLSIRSGDFQQFTQQDIKSAHTILLNIAKIIADRLRKTNKDMKKLTTVLTIALRRSRR
jgi:CRP/FNR family transcriptional regulator, cyclic AMP receptor protein